MSFLDAIFQDPQPSRLVHAGLYQLYMSAAVEAGQNAQWSEKELADRLTSMPDYLKFLNNLNDVVVQEIADVSDQIYGPLDKPNEDKESGDA